jgi:hypothetical protein
MIPQMQEKFGLFVTTLCVHQTAEKVQKNTLAKALGILFGYLASSYRISMAFVIW